MFETLCWTFRISEKINAGNVRETQRQVVQPCTEAAKDGVELYLNYRAESKRVCGTLTVRHLVHEDKGHDETRTLRDKYSNFLHKDFFTRIKSKAVSLHAMEAFGGIGGIAPTHS
jgi:hypothetical protein